MYYLIRVGFSAFKGDFRHILSCRKVCHIHFSGANVFPNGSTVITSPIVIGP